MSNIFNSLFKKSTTLTEAEKEETILRRSITSNRGQAVDPLAIGGRRTTKRETYALGDRGAAYVSNASDAPGTYSIKKTYVELDKGALTKAIVEVTKWVERPLSNLKVEADQTGDEALSAVLTTMLGKTRKQTYRFSYTSLVILVLGSMPHDMLAAIMAHEPARNMLNMWQLEDPNVSAGYLESVPYDDPDAAVAFIAQGRYLTHVARLQKLCNELRTKYDSSHARLNPVIDAAAATLGDAAVEMISGPEFKASVLNTYYAVLQALSGPRALATYAIDPAAPLPNPNNNFEGLDKLASGGHDGSRLVPYTTGLPDDEVATELSILAARYNTSIDELYDLNPALRGGIVAGEMLKIPSVGGADRGIRKYAVKPGDNVRIVADKFKTDVASLAKDNPALSDVLGLAKITIKVPVAPGKGGIKPYEIKTNDETVDSVAAKFSISASDLLAANPDLDTTLIGTGVQYDKEGNKITTQGRTPWEPGDVINIPTPVLDATPNKTEDYTTALGETSRIIAKKFGTTSEKLLALNPQVRDLEVGDSLVVSISGIHNYYTVEPGDTPGKIATKNNTTITDLYKANPDFATRVSGLPEKIRVPAASIRTPEAREITREVADILAKVTDLDLGLHAVGYSAKKALQYSYNKFAAADRVRNNKYNKAYNTQMGISASNRPAHDTAQQVQKNVMGQLSDKFSTLLSLFDLAISGDNLGISKESYDRLVQSVKTAVTNPSATPTDDARMSDADTFFQLLSKKVEDRIAEADPEAAERATKTLATVLSMVKNGATSSNGSAFARKELPKELIRKALTPLVVDDIIDSADANALINGLIQSTKSIDTIVADLPTESERVAAKKLIGDTYKPLLTIPFDKLKDIVDFGKYLKSGNILKNIRSSSFELAKRREVYTEYNKKAEALATALNIPREVLTKTILAYPDDIMSDWNRRYQFAPLDDESGATVETAPTDLAPAATRLRAGRLRIPYALYDFVKSYADYDKGFGAKLLERMKTSVTSAKASKESETSGKLTVKGIRAFFGRVFTNPSDDIIDKLETANVPGFSKDAADILRAWKKTLETTPGDTSGEIYHMIQATARLFHKYAAQRTIESRRNKANDNLSRAQNADKVASILLAKCVDFWQGLRNEDTYNLLSDWDTADDAQKEAFLGKYADFVDKLVGEGAGPDSLMHALLYNRMDEVKDKNTLYDPTEDIVKHIDNLLTNDHLANIPRVVTAPSPVEAAGMTIPDRCMSVMNLMCSWQGPAQRDNEAISKVFLTPVKQKYSVGTAGSVLTGDMFNHDTRREPMALAAIQALFIDRMLPAVSKVADDMESQDADTPEYIKTYTKSIISDLNAGVKVLTALRKELASTITGLARTQKQIVIEDSFAGETVLDISGKNTEQIISAVGSLVLQSDFNAPVYIKNSLLSNTMETIAIDTSDMLGSLFDYYSAASMLEANVATSRKEAMNGDNDTDVPGFQANIRAEVESLRKLYAPVLNIYLDGNKKAPLQHIHTVDLPSIHALLDGISTTVSEMSDEMLLADYKKTVADMKAAGEWSGSVQLSNDLPVLFMGIETATTVSDKDVQGLDAIDTRTGRVIVKSKGVIRTKVLNTATQREGKFTSTTFNPLGREKGQFQSIGYLKTYQESIADVRGILDNALKVLDQLTGLQIAPAVIQPLQFDIESTVQNLDSTSEILSKYVNFTSAGLSDLYTTGGQQEMLSLFSLIKRPSNEYNSQTGFSKVLSMTASEHAGVGYLLEAFVNGAEISDLAESLTEVGSYSDEAVEDTFISAMPELHKSTFRTKVRELIKDATDTLKPAMSRIETFIQTVSKPIDPSEARTKYAGYLMDIANIFEQSAIERINKLARVYLPKTGVASEKSKSPEAKSVAAWDEFIKQLYATRKMIKDSVLAYAEDGTGSQGLYVLMQALKLVKGNKWNSSPTALGIGEMNPDAIVSKASAAEAKKAAATNKTEMDAALEKKPLGESVSPEFILMLKEAVDEEYEKSKANYKQYLDKVDWSNPSAAAQATSPAHIQKTPETPEDAQYRQDQDRMKAASDSKLASDSRQMTTLNRAALVLSKSGWTVNGASLLDPANKAMTSWNDIFMNPEIEEYLYPGILYLLSSVKGVNTNKVSNLLNSNVYYTFKTRKIKNGRGLLAPVFNFDILYPALMNISDFDYASVDPNNAPEIDTGIAGEPEVGFDDSDETPKVTASGKAKNPSEANINLLAKIPDEGAEFDDSTDSPVGTAAETNTGEIESPAEEVGFDDSDSEPQKSAADMTEDDINALLSKMGMK